MNDQSSFRPWGELEWALGLSTQRRWNFYGCFGTEDRSVHGLCEFKRLGLLEAHRMIQIRDTVPMIAKDEETAHFRLRDHCRLAGLELAPKIFDLQGFTTSWSNEIDDISSGSVCLDISSMPKRFFFVYLKRLLKNPKTKDLVIIYTKPNRYTRNALSGNADQWAALSGFSCDDPDIEKEANARLIVNAGFAADGLREHLDGSGPELQVDLLIPFPTMPWKSVARSWESARVIEQGLQIEDRTGKGRERLSYHRVGALDTPSAFDMLLRLTQDGSFPSALAPLGPKPISVAMCILASQSPNFPVYYAQPKSYAIDYSTGSETIYAYWIKHSGKNLYAL
jgi:hypothetical protein